MAVRNVSVIPAKPMQELKGREVTAKPRVCAYCRVSTDNEEQLSSYEAQVTHYTDYIKRKDENGELVIVPEEAEVVRRIFREFLDGKSTLKIARGLQADGILTGAGKTKWWDTTVYQILKYEKYMGDALLQKSYTVDFLTKKRVINKGIIQQYYVEDSHPPIVPKEEFAAVQAEFVKRSSMRGYSKTGKSNFTSEYPFSGKLFCQNCGSKLRHTYFGTGKNKRGYWLCINHQMNGDKACNMRSLNEKHLELAFVRAMNKVIGGKDTFIATLMQNIYRGLETIEEEYTVEQIDARLQDCSGS